MQELELLAPEKIWHELYNSFLVLKLVVLGLILHFG
jgi:hypothetical protein